MGLEDLIYETKPHLDEFIMSEFLVKFSDKNRIKKGFLFEYYVKSWLKKIPGLILYMNIENSEVRKPYVYIPKTEGNFFVKNGKELLFEIDGLIEFNNKKYYIEVKSGGFYLNNKKIIKRLTTGFRSLKNFGGMIIFLPFTKNRNKIKKMSKSFYRTLYFINNNYNYEELSEIIYKNGYELLQN